MFMKKVLSVSIGVVFVFTPLLTFGHANQPIAIEGSSTVKVGTSTEARIKAKVDLDERRAELEAKKERLKAELEQKKEDLNERMDERKDAIKNKIEERKGEIENKIDDRKDKVMENIKERLGKFTQNVVERYNAAIERLDNLMERIDSRISKLESEGADVTKAKELSALAKIKIETAKTSVAAIEIDSTLALSASTSSSTPAYQEGFQILRSQLEKAKGDIKAAHASLIDIIENLKPGLNKRPTTTPTTASSTTN